MFALAGVLLTIGAMGLAVPSVSAAESRAQVVRLDLDEVVQPLSASYIVDGIEQAKRDRASAVLVRLDTPGGYAGSMRDVVGALLASEVPVICWVGPSGARAASAGTFILLACHVATMAPGTNVGAAHPVGLRGEVLAAKITNDSAAFIRSIAQARGRNADWAEKAVRDSVAISAPEARKLDVIDGVVSGPSEALRFADGHDVEVAGRDLELDTWPADVETSGMGIGRDLLGSLVDPNLAFLLFLVGIGLLLFEVLHPGFGAPGVLGTLALVLSLVMFEMLPVNLAGVVLLLAGIAFLVLEVHVPGFGAAGVAGVAALILGGLLLFDAGTLVRVSIAMLVGGVLAVCIILLVVLRGAIRARQMTPPPTKPLLGAEGLATKPLDPEGTVRVAGEEWSARAFGSAPIPEGARIAVVDQEGLRLIVDAVPEQPLQRPQPKEERR